ncbi:MAG: hypothetical protein R2752_06035 [Vicinamibacterales bacterium]
MTHTADAVDRVQQALDTLIRALESGRPQAVLDAEAPLAAAVGALGAGLPPPGRDAAGRRRLEAIRLQVARCRALGAAAADLSAAMFPQMVYARPARVAVRQGGRR